MNDHDAPSLDGNIFRHPPKELSVKLLDACGLPTADLTPQHFKHYLGCGRTEDLTGVIGLELFGPLALLRSLAVAASARNRGYGQALVFAAEEYAALKGVERLYLLTETAEPFFSKLGYACLERGDAPEQIKQTREYTDICPCSARLMYKHL